MNWIDVCGPPGVGKSSLCDYLWGPHAVQIEDRLPPESWHDFVNEASRLFSLISAHPTIGAAVRMNNRSFRKVATVARSKDKGPYIQTCLAQRGLGFGWRMNDMGIDLRELRPFFRLMPVSIGVAFLKASPETVKVRNHARKQKPETAHEDRAFMVDLMLPAIEVAKETLLARGIPVTEIDVEKQSIESARAELLAFAGQEPFDPEASGPRSEVEILSQPYWWKR